MERRVNASDVVQRAYVFAYMDVYPVLGLAIDGNGSLSEGRVNTLIVVPKLSGIFVKLTVRLLFGLLLELELVVEQPLRYQLVFAFGVKVQLEVENARTDVGILVRGQLYIESDRPKSQHKSPIYLFDCIDDLILILGNDN